MPLRSNDHRQDFEVAPNILGATSGESIRNGMLEIFKLIQPKEHGSWSLALEPLALGLLAAPSAAGGVLAITGFSAFFLRRPLKLAIIGKTDSRRTLAIICLAVLGMVAFAGLALAVRFEGFTRLWALIPAALFGMVFVWFDLQNGAREGYAELAGVVAFGILPAAFGALAHWSTVESIALAMVMLSRSVPTILFVRTYMRRRKGRPATPVPTLIAAGLACSLTGCLVLLHVAPWPAAVFVFILAARSLWLLSTRRRFSAKSIGIAELAFGVVMVLTVATAWKPL